MNTVQSVSRSVFLMGIWVYWLGGKAVALSGRVSRRTKRPGFLNGGGFAPAPLYPLALASAQASAGGEG